MNVECPMTKRSNTKRSKPNKTELAITGVALLLNIALTLALIVPLTNRLLALRVSRFQHHMIIAATIFVTMLIVNWVLSKFHRLVNLNDETVGITTPAEREKAAQSAREPITIGFPARDVRLKTKAAKP